MFKADLGEPLPACSNQNNAFVIVLGLKELS